MSKAAQLRQKAALCRRAAAVPTQGSTSTNRLLLEIAEQLECEAAALEDSNKDTGRAGG
jgi:hypothetical protein